MRRNRPISLNVLPDADFADLEASNLARMVINAYTTAMTFTRDETKAFEAAIRA